MPKKLIIIPEVFNIASTTISSDVARKILRQRVKKMSNVINTSNTTLKKPIVKPETQQLKTNDRLTKFNFLCGG